MKVAVVRAAAIFLKREPGINKLIIRPAIDDILIIISSLIPVMFHGLESAAKRPITMASISGNIISSCFRICDAASNPTINMTDVKYLMIFLDKITTFIK